MRILPVYILAVLLHFQVSARILMKPYLQAVTTTSVYVLVECDSRDTAMVMFGLSASHDRVAKTEYIAPTTASPATYIHKIQLTGLAPATRYFYNASQGKSISEKASFFTSVTPGMPFRLVWMADCRTGTPVFAKISRLMLQADPIVALYGGDLCFNAAYKSWKKEFFIPDQLAFASKVPFFNVPGNHEGWVQNTKAFNQNPACASGTQDYYSFDYGDMHVLCLNTEISCEKGSPQYEFAASDLASTHQPWKIVMAHKPAYCSGGHAENKTMISMTTAIFEPNKVDVFLAGHSHFYQHNLVNGIHHLVPGSAGAPLYNPVKANYTISQSKEHHFAVIDVAKDKLKIYIYSQENVLLDSFQIEK